MPLRTEIVERLFFSLIRNHPEEENGTKIAVLENLL